VFIVQLAETVAAGGWFLDLWRVPKPFVVGVIETEIHEVMLGQRLKSMFPRNPPPAGLRFLGEEGMKELRRQGSMALKLAYVRRWVEQEGIDVVVFDTANDFFRGDDNPSAEADVGAFFDLLRNMPVKARILVRHDRKKKEQDGDEGNTNELIRGSAEWKEDPELILYVKRADRRTNKIDFQVGKFRYGAKPDPMELWFDAGTFRLTALPPVIAVLEPGPRSRQQIIALAGQRFGLGERTVDLDLQFLGGFLLVRQVGHQKFYEIDRERAATAPWGEVLRRRGEDMQPCITTTLTAPAGDLAA